MRAAWVFVCIATLSLSCDSGGPEVAPLPTRTGRGATIEVEFAGKWTDAAISQDLAEAGVPLTPRFSVESYRVLYETVDVHGDVTQASGAVLVPSPTLHALPMLSFQHGTVVRKDQVPSRGSADQIIGLVFAADGYLVTMPDLVGLGDSPGMHPYILADVSATAVVDLLRAASDLAVERGWQLADRLFLAGYSQGGYTAMAAHRALESDYANEFTVTASAPMAGPYDLSGTMYELMISETPYPEPYYLPYLLLAYNEAYDLYASPSEFLRSPYDETLPPLFDGTHSGREINALMPSIPITVMRSDIVAEVKADSNHPFRQRLRENDLTGWTPRAPVRLYHCSGDRHVPIDNSLVAKLEMEQLGADVALLDPSPGRDHGGCVVPSLLGARAWFNAWSGQ